MAAYRRVYDSRHQQADCKEPELRSVIEYGLPFYRPSICSGNVHLYSALKRKSAWYKIATVTDRLRITRTDIGFFHGELRPRSSDARD